MGRRDPDETAGLTAAGGYRLLFERVDNMVCTLDLQGRFTSINPAGERLTGYAAEALIGRPAVELIAPELREEAARQFQRRLGGSNEGANETVLITREGTRIPIQVASTIFPAEGPPMGVLGLVHDLTERKKAAEALQQTEEALLQSEQRFRSSFESAPIGMALVAPDGRFLQVNASLCELVGYSAEELVAKTFQEITHPEDLELDLEYVRQMLDGEIRTYQMEKRYFHRLGDIVWILLSVSLVRTRDGAPLHFIAQIQDITERKRAQEALEQSETQLAEAQQIAHVGSWQRDFATGAISASDELFRIYGFDPASTELNDERVLERVHPEDVRRFHEVVAQARETDEPFALEYRIVLPDGRVRWVHGRGQRLLGDDGPVAVRGTAQDITEQKEAEHRLAEAEQRYRTLVEQLPLGTYVRPLDMSQPDIYASPQVEPMLGYPAAEWETNPGLLASIVHPGDRARVLADAARVRTTGEPIRAEYRYIARDGRTVWVQDETYIVCDESGEPAFVQGFLLDITERKRAEAERDRLHDQLHHAQRLEAIGRLAGGVAHDFNNMLTAIKGYSELLLDKLDPNGQLHNDAAQILRAADQASELPRQLLAFSREQTLEPRLVDLNEVVSSSSRLLKHFVTEAIELVTKPAAAAAYAFVDPARVEHVLVNLALNARDAMPEGGKLTIATSNVEVGGELAAEHDASPGPYVVITVADTGEGMDADVKARAFEPFFTTKAQGEGSGLGLASVYGTVTQSGGFVTLKSAPARGSTFEIHFPCAQVPAASNARPASAPPASAPMVTVLLAEDEDIVRELATSVLEHAGFHVSAATNGVEALHLFERLGGSVHVLVTDMVMPGMGGRELAERIIEADTSIPIVFMSGYTEEAPPAAIGDGAGLAFLQKPFSSSELVRIVKQMLGAGLPVQGNSATHLTCLVADDHPAVLDSISGFLESRGIEVSRAARGDEALSEIESKRPSLALLDIAMEPLTGIEVARQVAQSTPETRTVLYTGHRDRALLEQALEAGARGFVLKEAPLSELERALSIVAEGGTYVDPQLSGALVSPSSVKELSPLTPREQEILSLVANGLTNDKIGSALAISPETVQSHVRNAMGKLEADTRTQAVATALRQSLIA